MNNWQQTIRFSNAQVGVVYNYQTKGGILSKVLIPCELGKYLKMAAEGCVVQSSPASSVWHVHIAELRDEGFGTAHSLVRCCDVKRRLPVLVPGIYVSRVFQQHLDGLLQKNFKRILRLWTPVSLWSCELPRNRVVYAYLAAGGHSPVQRSEPLVIFGIYSGTYKSNDTVTVRKKTKITVHSFFSTVLNFYCLSETVAMKDKPTCISQFGIQKYQLTTDQNHKWLRQELIIYHSLHQQVKEKPPSDPEKVKMWKDANVGQVKPLLSIY